MFTLKMQKIMLPRLRRGHRLSRYTVDIFVHCLDYSSDYRRRISQRINFIADTVLQVSEIYRRACVNFAF